MKLLHTAGKYAKERNNLKIIYKTYARPVLEQSSVVWHSNLTLANSIDIEVVQKAATRLFVDSGHEEYDMS